MPVTWCLKVMTRALAVLQSGVELLVSALVSFII